MNTESCSPFDVFCYLEWVFAELNAFVLYLTDMFLSGVVTLFEIIPAPDFLLNAQSVGGSIAPGALYFMTLFLLPTGLTMIVTAYTLRFLLRRIPFIG
jgi:hypothetical protein